jgi:uncharacterized LabA/DUF88 family protein
MEHYDTDNLVVYYYTSYPEEGTRPYSTAPKHSFFTFLEKSVGFVVRKKPLKIIHKIEGQTDTPFEKGNMDVEIAIDAVNRIKDYDIAVFFSGDSDFLALVNFIRNQQKRVYVFSSKNNVSREMRTGSDGYIDLLRITNDIWRNPLKRRKR